MNTENFVMTHESARLMLTVWYENGKATHATVSNLYSIHRRQGHATELMAEACRYADRNGLDLYLTANRYGRPIGPDNLVLIKFYEKFGFSIENRERSGAFMKRPSQFLHGL